MCPVIAPPCISPPEGMAKLAPDQRAAFRLLLKKIKKKDGWPAHGTAPQPRSRGKACQASAWQVSCDHDMEG